MRTNTRLVVLAAIVVLASGCARLFGGAGVPAELLGQWVLVGSQVDGAPIDVPDGTRVTLQVEEDSLGGTAACNHYGGEHRIGAGRFVLTDGLAVTEMGCDPAVMDTERRYLEALGRVEVIQRADEQLLLMGQGVELRFDPVAPVEDEAITGTRWLLDTLVEGDTASSVRGDAFLQLHDDGTLDGSTGCRDLRGRWETSGDEIVFPEFGAEGECPAEFERQDAIVVTVLGDGFRAEVDGGRLTLTSSGGEGGLVYRSEG